VNVEGRPRGERPACVGDAACDGITFTPPFECNGNGACAAPRPRDCPGGFKCSDEGCLDSCTSDVECDVDKSFHCELESSECQPTDMATCSEDLTMAVPIAERAQQCGAYLCDPSSGTCRTECSSIDDCSSGHVCDPNRTCVPDSTNDAGSADGACGCRVTGAPTPRSRHAFLLAFVALALLRRRSRARPD
jgi:MYXO-CTERM domain-containing protein